jgi:aminoglycoside N3'-acetyltransferase
MITIIYLVDEYGIAFKNKKDAAAYLRENEYNEKKLAHLKRAFNLDMSEKDIVESINNGIREVKLQ